MSFELNNLLLPSIERTETEYQNFQNYKSLIQSAKTPRQQLFLSSSKVFALMMGLSAHKTFTLPEANLLYSALRERQLENEFGYVKGFVPYSQYLETLDPISRAINNLPILRRIKQQEFEAQEDEIDIFHLQNVRKVITANRDIFTEISSTAQLEKFSLLKNLCEILNENSTRKKVAAGLLSGIPGVAIEWMVNKPLSNRPSFQSKSQIIFNPENEINDRRVFNSSKFPYVNSPFPVGEVIAGKDHYEVSTLGVRFACGNPNDYEIQNLIYQHKLLANRIDINGYLSENIGR